MNISLKSMSFQYTTVDRNIRPREGTVSFDMRSQQLLKFD